MSDTNVAKQKFGRHRGDSLRDYDPLSTKDVWAYAGKPYRWAMAITRGSRWQVFFTILTIMITPILELLPSYFVSKLINEVIVAGDHSHMWLYLAILLGVPVLRGIVIFIKRLLYTSIALKIHIRVIDVLYKHLQELDADYYSKTPTGRIMARLTGDVEWVDYFFSWASFTTIQTAFSFILAGVFFFVIEWRLALITMIVAPFIFWASLRLQRSSLPVWQSIRQEFESLNAVVQQNINGNRTTRAFVRHDYEIAKFEQENQRFAGLNKMGADVRARYIPVMDALASFMNIPVILFGGILAIKGFINIGEVVLFNNSLGMLIFPMRNLGYLIDDMQHCASSMSKIIELLMVKTKISSPVEVDASADKRKLAADEAMRGYIPVPDKPFPLVDYKFRNSHANAKRKIDDIIHDYSSRVGMPRIRLKGEVEFEHVYFNYYLHGNKVKALKDITFKVEPGQTVGIIGETGAGKTTLVELISRLADPAKGRVLIDGKDLREYPLQELRRSIHVVTQDVFLFSDTVESNIAFSDPVMAFEDIKKSAEIARADKFIAEMPEKYYTIIGEEGVGLSGGQRQRLSLARAVSGDPDILILDDTTSAVDMNTDAEIRAQLKQNFADKTVFMIAQRISSIRNADLILVMKKGKIIQSGTHDELLKEEGFYRDIYETQVGDTKEALQILIDSEKKAGDNNG